MSDTRSKHIQLLALPAFTSLQAKPFGDKRRSDLGKLVVLITSTNGEIGNICAWNFKQVAGYNVQLEWSNQKNKRV